MSPLSKHRPIRSRLMLPVALAALALLLVFSGRAEASELVFWDNYKAEPQTIGMAGTDGAGGGALNLAGIDLKDPEGITFDSVTGRLYIASSAGGTDKKGQIVYVNVDGSGAGVLSTPGTAASEPYGVDIDPITRTIYWVNGSNTESKGSIGFAKLDGSGGGTLNTSGVKIEDPYKLAVDLVTGKLYFGNEAGTSIGFANLNNTGGGGTLNVTGAPPLANIYAVAVDAAAGRVYWLDSTAAAEHLSFASVNGGGGGEVSLAGAPFADAYGLAIDPSIGRAYWANYGQDKERSGVIGFTGLAGGGAGGITPATAPVDGTQDPVILKSPTATGAPTLVREAKARSALACSQGTWGADYTGGFVFQAPRTFAYQWALNGSAIAGATASTLTATTPGSYACSVTAANQAGSATVSSAPITEKAAKLKLVIKKRKAVVKAGKPATFKVQATNQGDIPPKAARLCVKVPKKAKKALKAAKCKPLKLNAAGKGTAKVKVKTKKSAAGSYKVKLQPKGVGGKPAKATIIVK